MQSRRSPFFFLALLFSMTGCGASPKERHKPVSPVTEKEQPAQESWNVDLVISDSGIPKTVLHAGHAMQSMEGQKKEIHLDGGVSVRIVNTNGSSILITAGRGVVHDNHDIEAFDRVVITSEDGVILRTEHITRSVHDRMIRSEKYVTITSPTHTIQGYGFESDDAMKRYRIFHASGEALSQ